VGLRVNHGLNLHHSKLAIGKHVILQRLGAPPPGRRRRSEPRRRGQTRSDIPSLQLPARSGHQTPCPVVPVQRVGHLSERGVASARDDASVSSGVVAEGLTVRSRCQNGSVPKHARSRARACPEPEEPGAFSAGATPGSRGLIAATRFRFMNKNRHRLERRGLNDNALAPLCVCVCKPVTDASICSPRPTPARDRSLTRFPAPRS
jgi:hypothetical protein